MWPKSALETAAFLKAVENSIPSGLAAVSDDGEQVFVNAKLATMLGWAQDELLGKRPPFVYWPPEEVDRIESVLQDAVAGKIAQSGAEITLMRRSGERFPVQLFISRIGYERRPGWLALVIDISNRKRVEAALEQSRRLESIGLLAGQVAHDFNNLLMIISMNVAVLERALQNDAKSTELLNGVGEATKRGIAITKTLLTVASRQELAPQRVDLKLQLEQCKQLFVASCGPSIKIILELPLESVWVDVDTGGLSGALLNLVNNARDAMSDGGTITLRLSTRFIETPTGSRRTGNYGVIEVVDTGQGMEPEVMARAFEPFFSTKGSSGTGLGLATVYGFSH